MRSDRPDFSKQIKIGENFQGQDLSSANFAEAELGAANFTDANLKLANFNRAAIGCAIMHGANLQRAMMIAVFAVCAHFRSANMCFVDAEGADFEGARMDALPNSAPTSLWCANLKNASFKSANLEGVDFRSANLEGVNFEGATLDGVDLVNAILKDAQLRYVNLDKVKLYENILEADYDYCAVKFNSSVNNQFRIKLMVNTIAKFEPLISKSALFAEAGLVRDVVNLIVNIAINTLSQNKIEGVKQAKDDLHAILNSIDYIVRNDNFWLKQSEKSPFIPKGIANIRQILADQTLSDVAKWLRIEEIAQQLPVKGFFGGERMPLTSEFYKAILDGDVKAFEIKYNDELKPQPLESGCALQ